MIRHFLALALIVLLTPVPALAQSFLIAGNAPNTTFTVELGATDNAVLDAIAASLVTIDGRVDGLEGLLATQAGYLDGLEGAVDGIEALLSTIDGRVDQLESYVDGLEGLIGTTNTNTGNSATSLASLDDLVLVEDGAHVSGEAGVMIFGVRNDAGTTLAGTDGDRMPLSLDANGELRVSGAHLAAIESATEAMAADIDTLLTRVAADVQRDNVASETGPQTQIRFDDVSPDPVDEGDAASWRGSSTGVGYVQLRDAAGNERGVNVNASNQLAIAGPVTNAGTFAVQVDGSALTALQAIQTAVQLLDNVETGATPFDVPVTTASNNFTTALAGAGRLMNMTVVNPTATVNYIKFYNDAAMVTGDCASATNLLFKLAIPGDTSGRGWSVNFGPSGMAFSTGIGYCIVGGSSTTDNSNGVAGITGVLGVKQ
jgi:hypothetical protein